MDTYRKYREARDTAWRALLQLEEKSLPVDPEALARRVGVEIMPFPDPNEEEKLAALLEKAGGGSCVSLRIQGKWHIFLRTEALDGSRRRFSVAHELGHLLMDHETYALMPGVRAFAGRENAGDLIDDPQSLDDYAADIFAIRLLAPACVLHEMHVDQSGQIIALCGLPPRAAALRAERMGLLNERDAFYNHPLERQVRDQFLPFIRSRQTAAARECVSPVQPVRKTLPAPLPRPKAAELEPPSQATPRPQASAPETPDGGTSDDTEKLDADEAPAPSSDDPVPAPDIPRKISSWLWLAALTIALALLILFLSRSGS